MDSFGWLVGIEYNAHLSHDDDACFSCLLVTNWARSGPVWMPDANASPGMDAATCQKAFGDWLTPWRYAPVAWQLWKLVTAGSPSLVPLDATPQPTMPAPSEKQAGALRAEARNEISYITATHTDAMKLEVAGVRADQTPVLSYPIAAAGMAHLTAAPSESVFGLSCVMHVSVSAASLTAGDQVVATPVFFADDRQTTRITVDPTTLANVADGTWAVNFPAGGFGTVAGAGYAISVVTQPAPGGTPSTAQAAPVSGHAIIGAGRPLRAIYADVGQRVFPASVWLNALVPNLSSLPDDATPAVTSSNPIPMPAFLATLVYWLGCGEDERGQPPAPPLWYSLFEMLCTPGTAAASLFPPPAQAPASRWQDALRNAWIAELAKPDVPSRLLSVFVKQLRAAGEATLAGNLDKLLDYAPGAPLTGVDVVHAWRIVRTMTSGSTAALTSWASWLQAVVEHMSDSMGGDKVRAAVVQAGLAADALFAHDNPGQANPQAMFLQDDCARLIAGKLDEAELFWEQLHAAADDVAAKLKAEPMDALLDALSARQTLEPAQKTNAMTYITAQATQLAAADSTGARSADDPPLRIRYVVPKAGAADDGQVSLRGYLICLRAGLPLPAHGGIDHVQPQSGPAWINDCEACLTQRDSLSGTISTGDPLVDGTGKTIRLHDATGATMNDGLLDVETEYDGHSLYAFAAAADAPDLALPLLRPCAPKNVDLPRVGFGMVYRGLVASVDNAGVILDPNLRSTDAPMLPGEPIATPVDSAFGDAYQYLSRQTPGLARFVDVDDNGVTEDTLCFAALAAEARTTLESPKAADVHAALADGSLSARPKVVTLFDGDAYAKTQPASDFTLRAPGCSARFIQRWLNTDWLSASATPSRWDRIATATQQQIDELIQCALTEAAKPGGGRSVTNPAVVALRVNVSWIDEMGRTFADATDQPATLRLPLSHVSAGPAWLWDEQFSVRAQRGAKRQLQRDNSGRVVVTVPPGFRARIDVASIVDSAYFDDTGTRARLVPSLIKDFTDEGNGLSASASCVTQWIEALSDVAVEVPDAFVSALDLAYPGHGTDRAEMTVMFDTSTTLPARWLRGFTATARRWRWSGYPVEMPAAGAANPATLLEPWLPIYVGTDNSQPAHPDGAFVTAVNQSHGWLVSGCVMQPVHLPEQRVAMHAGLELTPILRFRSILKPALVERVERDPVRRAFRYTVLRGASDWTGHARFPVPVWSEHIPLTETQRVLERGTAQPQATGKGALLLFNDALYDTSDGAALGGIGERLDVDVVGTWRGGIDEIGPNPIFHGAPAADYVPPRLVLDPPFGLSYDQAVAGAPVQTAVVLRPADGDDDGLWLLARIRVRRYVDPDFRLDGPLQPAVAEATGGVRFSLSTRLNDNDWVPCDVAIDASEPVPAMQIYIDNGPFTLTLPEDPPGMPPARRYLLSFEKGRWSGATPMWRAHVALLARRGETSAWDTMNVSSAYKQRDLPALHAESVVQLETTILQAPPLVRRLLMSDFTDARWVSLIGSFEQPGLGDPSRYAFEVSADGIAIVARDDAPLPVVRSNDDLRPTLLLFFRPQPDVMRGTLETHGGRLVGVYSATGPSAQKCIFDTQVLPLGDVPAKKCQAVLISVQQRHTGEDTIKIDRDDWTTLRGALFPVQSSQVTEASMRLLPEYLGPLSEKRGA